jgi:alkylation response protein AidB-like acyl-CoA dehydrogenase
MDFEDTREEAEFRARARAFLEKAAPRREGTNMLYRAATADAGFIAQAKDYQARKADAGFAGITWPKEWGGQGGSAIEQVIFDQEEAKFGVPRGIFEIGLGMCIPTLCTWGTQAHRDRYARRALRGEEIWCQLFSEPAGGSDLAALRTRAERDGDDWIINGQKIWTSGAHYSDFGVIVTRSDFDAPKHKGLTYFFLDMKSPGIEIRPIKQISGASHFNEVFFTNVRIPDSQRLGGVVTDPALAPMAALFQQTLMTSPSSRIAGGSDEIMRNIIAERVLGLPPDIRVDKDIPFNKVPTGKKG